MDNILDDCKPTMGTTLDAASAANNDSLEAGEIVDDTPPIAVPPEDGAVNSGSADGTEDDLKNTSGDLDDLDVSVGERQLNTSSSDKSGSSKPVFGKEKAKQRLKALGIQKKIQMASKQSRPAKVSRKKSREKSGSRSNLKKDKPPTPHEKAKLTKEEIEKLKEKQDCALPCLYYDAAMIHHIRAESTEKKVTATAGKTEPCLTASLEAIKNYEDHDELADSADNSQTNYKIPPPMEEAVVSEQRPGSNIDFIRNYKQARRKLNFRGAGEHQYFAIRGRKRFGPDRFFHPHFRNIRNFRDPVRRIHRELPKLPQILSEGRAMNTKTKPVITFSINPNILKTPSSTTERRKSRKKNKRKSSEHKTRPKKKSRSKSCHKDSKKLMIVQGKKKKKTGKKERHDKKERRRKSKHKRNNPPKTCGALSFHLSEFLPEEEIETFPLSKDTVEVIEEQDEEDVALQNKLKSLQEELNKKSPSPDTDDYMANWEEDEDFATVSFSKDSTPKVLASAPTAGGTPPAQIGNSADGTSPDGSRTPLTAPILPRSSSPLNTGCDNADDSDIEEIRDGLGTPIYVNPSPPPNLLAEGPGPDLNTTPPMPLVVKKEVEEIEKVELPPRKPNAPLFGMQVIYEQFIQSVSEAGIELSLNKIPIKPTRDAHFNHPEQTTDDDECSFTPNASPTGGKKCEEDADEDIPQEKGASSRSRSSTPTDSSSDSASSSSSTTSDTLSSSPPVEKKSDDRKCDATKESENIEKKIGCPAFHLPSILSPEDTQKLRSLHKRSKMLKTLQEQSDTMDDEDKQCLLGLEKLIEAEKNLLMRKYDVARDLTEELKFSDASSTCDSPETGDAVTPPRNDSKDNTPDDMEVGSGVNKIFDVNREAVKLKFSPKTPKSTSKVVSKPSEEDDQDFTEKLLKTPPPCSKEHTEGGERKKRERKFSRSISRSPEGQKSVRKGRSLSISPTRRSRDQWGDKQKRSKRQKHYSPSPSSRKRADSKKSRSHRWALSPLIRKRSRSPYSRRFSRSPPFRPPSPKSPPPPGRSRSPSKERNLRQDVAGGPVLQYPWSDDPTANYYPQSDSYYYIPSPAQGGQKGRPCEGGEFYHPNYRLYNYDYAAMGLYANNYGNEYVGPEPMNSYSRIPVINSTGGNYYYDDFSTNDNLNSPGAPLEANDSKEFARGELGGNSAEKTQFVVQKGNVLEIVPTSIIPKVEVVEPEEENVLEPVVKIEEIDESYAPFGGNFDHKIDPTIVVKTERTSERRKKKRRSQEFVAWEDEIAKRHIMSAVLRLNKEDDGTLRGILCNKVIGVSEKQRDKKRVIFADGIPPGKSSSTSDEDSPTFSLRMPRRIKRRRRHKGENKENEASMGFNMGALGLIDCFKVDPELENLPPPPPPPGDPLPHLPQPVLLKPPSPEQFLYFHFDPVVSSMYISNSPTPMPPRLLNRGIPPSVLPQQTSCVLKIPSNNPNNIPLTAPPPQPSQITSIAKGCFNPREPNNEQQMTSSPNLEVLPPSIAPTLQHLERRFRLHQHSFLPQMMLGAGDDFRPQSPNITSGFSMFNRPPLRASSVGLNRSEYPMPPPSPQQQQQMLGHPSIPFGPRPPGGVANFNRNIPPPFITPKCESPSMISNFQPIPPGPGTGLGPVVGVGNMRSPGSVQLFTPNPGSLPGFATPTVTVRPPGMNSPIVAFSNSGFTPPPSPVNVKSMSTLMGKGGGVPPGQFSRIGGCDNFIPHNSQPLPTRPGGPPFNTSGMPLPMHRPNLGFPRSFGPPPPPNPQMQQQMFMQQQQQLQGAPMFASPNGNFPFLRNDAIKLEPDVVQHHPQHPPHPSQGPLGGNMTQ